MPFSFLFLSPKTPTFKRTENLQVDFNVGQHLFDLLLVVCLFFGEGPELLLKVERFLVAEWPDSVDDWQESGLLQSFDLVFELDVFLGGVPELVGELDEVLVLPLGDDLRVVRLRDDARALDELGLLVLVDLLDDEGEELSVLGGRHCGDDFVLLLNAPQAGRVDLLLVLEEGRGQGEALGAAEGLDGGAAVAVVAAAADLQLRTQQRLVREHLAHKGHQNLHQHLLEVLVRGRQALVKLTLVALEVLEEHVVRLRAFQVDDRLVPRSTLERQLVLDRKLRFQRLVVVDFGHFRDARLVDGQLNLRSKQPSETSTTSAT